jgi:tRNA modification GTPase
MTVAAIEPTRVVMLTAAGRGAVACLLVEGPGAVAAVDALFHPATRLPLTRRPRDRIVLGRWQSSEHGEELVVCRRDEQRVEIHCHGGHAAAGAIIASLVERGCEEASWQDWACASHADPIASAARIALAAAPTERTATILWDQYTGALARALREIEGLVHSRDGETVLARVDELLHWANLGAHLVRPWQVVFAGAPNVGKSSLTNALLGYERAIVHDMPGTTRDVVSAVSALDGWPIELADTAGQRSSDEPLEAAGIRLAQDRSTAADLVVLVFNASQPDPDRERALSERWPQALRVFNKCDLLPPGSLRADHTMSGLYASALLGTGIDELGREIVRRLVPAAPPSGQAVPFTTAQVDFLVQVRSAVLAGELDAASNALGECLAGHCES